MKKFLVVEEQGGGCDYTIGCGIATYFISAESMEAAVAQLKAAAFSDGEHESDEGGGLLDTDEYRRTAANVYEVAASAQLPLVAWRKERKVAHEAAVAAAKEQDERDTLAKLQKKYGA